jgi:hypothetical protein
VAQRTLDEVEVAGLASADVLALDSSQRATPKDRNPLKPLVNVPVFQVVAAVVLLGHMFFMSHH